MVNDCFPVRQLTSERRRWSTAVTAKRAASGQFRDDRERLLSGRAGKRASRMNQMNCT